MFFDSFLAFLLWKGSSPLFSSEWVMNCLRAGRESYRAETEMLTVNAE